MRIIAFEGPSCAGKSTAIAAIATDPSLGRIETFDCYVQAIPRREHIPPPRTTSRDQQLEAFGLFMSIEAARVSRVAELVQNGWGPDIVFLDRSVDTLIAHARALDILFDLGAHAAIFRELGDRPHLVPDLTIYLDVAGPVLRERHERAGATPGEYFLHDDAFLVAWRDYFLGPSPSTVTLKVVRVDAGCAPAHVASVVRGLL